MKRVKEAIVDYINHLQDGNYIRSTIHLAKSKTLFDALIVMLQSRERDASQAATLFIRDVFLLAPDDIRLWFRSHLYESETLAAISQNLKAPDHFVRCDAVYTLGKIGARECLNDLKVTFTFYRERDPLLIPRLLMEMSWLGYRPRWPLIDQLVNSPSYLSRWAALAVMDDGLLKNSAKGCRLEKLARDQHPAVAHEAAYRLRCWQSQQEDGSNPLETRAERKRRWRNMHQSEPEITFRNVETRFRNELWRAGKADYQLSELEEFVEQLEQSTGD